MNCIKVLVLLSTFFASLRMSEQASFNIKYFRHLIKRQVADPSSSPSPSPSQEVVRTQKSVTLRNRDRPTCEVIRRYHKISVNENCEVNVYVGTCYGHCPSMTTPDVHRQELSQHCRCCRPVQTRTAFFKVDCNTKRAVRYTGVRNNQQMVRVPEATSCSCRPVRCALS